jgi:hypothetical protein
MKISIVKEREVKEAVKKYFHDYSFEDVLEALAKIQGVLKEGEEFGCCENDPADYFPTLDFTLLEKTETAATFHFTGVSIH